jgi:hypothetical protein
LKVLKNTEWKGSPHKDEQAPGAHGNKGMATPKWPLGKEQGLGKSSLGMFGTIVGVHHPR